jgi:hypothetical protein
MKIEPGRVYLGAPDHHLLLSGDNILIGRGPPENMVVPRVVPRVRELMAGGHDTRQAERLVDLLKQSLVEWERHRILIAQRVTYLQQEVEAG